MICRFCARQVPHLVGVGYCAGRQWSACVRCAPSASARRERLYSRERRRRDGGERNWQFINVECSYSDAVAIDEQAAQIKAQLAAAASPDIASALRRREA